MRDEAHKPNPGDSEHGLNSAEYRHRLLAKLNSLIAVLEVAIGKIRRTLEQGTGNRERLERIRNNLENTLAICRRAKHTLETRLLEDASAPKPRAGEPTQRSAQRPRVSFRSYVELSSIEEFRKFKEMPAITREEIEATDVDELLDRLLGEDDR